MSRNVEYRDKIGIFTTFSPSSPRLSFFTQFYTSLCVEVQNTVTNQELSRPFPHPFHGCHSLLSSTLLYVQKCRIPCQTRVSSPFTYPSHSCHSLVIVPGFSSCGSVEDRDKLGLPHPLNSRSFFRFTLLNRDILVSAELRHCVLMPSGNNQFVVDKFPELVATEISRPNRSRYSYVITLPVTASNRQNAHLGLSVGIQ